MKHLQLLGHTVRDRVTGFSGVVSSVAFDLYGCVQAVVTPAVHIDDKGVQQTSPGNWFDVKRLQLFNTEPVMQAPDFEQPEIGSADKPPRQA